MEMFVLFVNILDFKLFHNVLHWLYLHTILSERVCVLLCKVSSDVCTLGKQSEVRVDHSVLCVFCAGLVVIFQFV